MQETVKKLREERSTGGDIAVMKSEIHKMEMRLSHLRRIQDKLIHDMEFCVARRDIILDRVMSKFKNDPKGRHNQKVIFSKRLADQKLKIKQLTKVRKLSSQLSFIESEYKRSRHVSVSQRIITFYSRRTRGILKTKYSSWKIK